jgi:hypothetical protein
MLAHWHTDWTGIPREDRYARPAQWIEVEDRQAVLVKRGSIRKAAIRDTVFLLSDEPRWLGLYRDHYRVSVQCLWFGRKPAGSWMHILVLAGDYQVQEHYAGKVVVNIARRPAHNESEARHWPQAGAPAAGLSERDAHEPALG